MVASGERETFGTENVREKEETRGRGRLVLLHPESPRDPQETEDGPGSPDEIRPFSGRKREPGDATGPFFGAGAKKSPGEAFLGARLEMP